MSQEGEILAAALSDALQGVRVDWLGAEDWASCELTGTRHRLRIMGEGAASLPDMRETIEVALPHAFLADLSPIFRNFRDAGFVIEALTIAAD